MIHPEVREVMVADLMRDMKEACEARAAVVFQDIHGWDFVASLPYLLKIALEEVTGLKGEEVFDRYDLESKEIMSNGEYKHNTIVHALYRLFEDSLVIATSVTYNTAQDHLFGGQ